MNRQKRRTPRLLLVEDDPGDVRLAFRMFDQFKTALEVDVVNDGEAALEFMYQEGKYGQAYRPDLVLLDLNLPKVSGLSVLKTVKSDPDLSTIPVLILTSSEAHDDIQNSYRYHANCYLTKPIGLEQFQQLMRMLEEFWFTTVTLPPHQ